MLCLSLVLMVPVSLAAQSTLYWDTNGKTAGAGGPSPSGTWSTSNSQKEWSSNSGGTVNPKAWTAGSSANFSAGTDATGAYTVTVNGTQDVTNITVDEGALTLDSGTINFNGASSNFIVNSTSAVTVNSDISGSIGLTKSGSGTLVFDSSDKSYTGTTTVSAGILQLNFNQSFDTVTLGGGTLLLSSVSTSITTLNVTANSIIDFGGAIAALNLTNLSVSSGVTLSIINWTVASDFFSTNAWAGATQDLPNNGNTAPLNRVVFAGFGADKTGWDSYDNQIRPNVPEPSTYGALLISILAGFSLWRRWQWHRPGA